MRRIALAACALGLTACGGQLSSGHTSDVSIEFTHVEGWAPAAGGTALECPEEHGTADGADMTKACKILESLPREIFDGDAHDTACGEAIYGPETAHLKGTVNGRDVDAQFNRRNTCNNERWLKIAPLVQAVTSPPKEPGF
jgi:hypothetical protein